MKKIFVLLLAAAFIFLIRGGASAEDALEITSSCVLNLSGTKNPKNLTDRKFTTYQESKSMKNPTLTVGGGEPIYGLYLCFQRKPESYEIQVKQGGEWETVCTGNEYIHAFYALDGAEEVRVYALGEKKQTLAELKKGFTVYPQVLKNIRVKDKREAQNDKDVVAKVVEVAEALGDAGRILVRESGTEPVVRVMVEAETKDICDKYVDSVIEVIKAKGHEA